MKISTLLIFFLLLCSQPVMKAQGLTPSTVRQVFSLQKGDSLEYHVWNYGACSPLCNYYILKVVDSVSYNLAQDTLSISFLTQVLHFDSAGGGGMCSGTCKEYFTWADICPIAVGQWTFTYLDSNIISFLDTTYRIQSPVGGASDSIYRDSLTYNNSKQNFYNCHIGFDGTNDIYADSIGIVYKAENVELSSNEREQLIYYHKANGSMWGTPYINTGIANIATDYHITVYPNPAEDRFVVHSDLYQGVRFEMYDVLSKQVVNLELNNKETGVNRNNLPSGIYYWQVTDGINTIITGKLIIE
jgi:hypothetical protein